MNKALIFWVLIGYAISMFGISDAAYCVNQPKQNIRAEIMLIDVNRLLKKEFKNDNKVVIIHDDTTSGEGKLHYGKLRLYKKYCIVGDKRFSWKHVIFMSHDGFPCRTLNINMSTEQLNDIDNEETMLLMRKVLADEVAHEEAKKLAIAKEKAVKAKEIVDKRKAKESGKTKSRGYFGCGGGCPFVFEDVRMEILNSGIIVPQYEETLVMTSKDGARGFMWDIDNEIFDFWKN